jgi:putative DNA primase/helicase
MGEVIQAKKMREKIAGAKALQNQDTTRPAAAVDANGRHVIRHDNGKLPEIVDALEVALAGAPELNLYRHASRLAVVYQASEATDGAVRRPAGAIMVHPVEAAHLVELAGRAASHEKHDARANADRPCDCPRRVAEAFLARGHWPKLADLTGFVETPLRALDGRLIDQPGYDATSGLFCAFTEIPGYLRPLEKPSQADALRAAERIKGLFANFPFVDDADKTAMLAGILTAILRRVLPAAPMFCITAPTPGTGKTLVCESFAIVATNRRASVLSLGHDDAETEKRLAGVLLAGDAVISVDNIERPLKGDLLCQVATQQFVRLRPLGGSGMLNVPTHALLIATGNNLAVIGDLKRRVLMIRLDAQTERPEQRTFNRDHLAEITARRGEIITDALTICGAYLTAGEPKIDGLFGFGGFEQWDRMVRRPLVWLGLPDPLLPAEGLRDQDPDLEAMRLLFTAWRRVVADGMAVTAAELLNMGGAINQDLHDALQLVCSEKANGRRLGFWLRSHRNRIVDSLQLLHAGADGHAKVAKWKVAKCG